MNFSKPLSFTAGAALAGALAGCGGGETEGGSSVTGKAIDSYHTEAGIVEKPTDSTVWTAIDAIVQDSDGMETVYPGSLAADGTFEIPGVPEGPYFLVLTYPPPDDAPQLPGARAYYRETARTLDFGAAYSYRPDVAPVTKPTGLTVAATLTKPWQTLEFDAGGNVVQGNEDILTFVSKNAGIFGTVLANPDDPTQSASPLNGATSLTGWQINATAALSAADDNGARLVESDKGDDLTILHAVASVVTTAGAPASDPWAVYSYTSVAEAFTPAPVTVTDGATTSLPSGSFQALTPKTFSFDYGGPAFGALLKDLPVAQPASYLTVSLDFEAAAPVPQSGAYAQLLQFQVYGVDENGLVAPTTSYSRDYEYGNPFTSGQELATVTFSFYTKVDDLLPEDGTPERLRGQISITDSAAKLSGTTLKPWLGLPRNVTVNGKPALVQEWTTGIGTSPVIAFEAPAFGTPDYYAVTVVSLDDVKDGDEVVYVSTTVARFFTSETSVEIPDGILSKEKHYYFRVAAYLHPGHDFAAPYAYSSARGASAITYTGIVVP